MLQIEKIMTEDPEFIQIFRYLSPLFIRWGLRVTSKISFYYVLNLIYCVVYSLHTVCEYRKGLLRYLNWILFSCTIFDVLPFWHVSSDHDQHNFCKAVFYFLFDIRICINIGLSEMEKKKHTHIQIFLFKSLNKYLKVFAIRIMCWSNINMTSNAHCLISLDFIIFNNKIIRSEQIQ